MTQTAPSDQTIPAPSSPIPLEALSLLERKVLWLSSWMIHNANHLRPHRDGVKVGGHQASCASAATLMTALFFRILKAEDRIAVKPHASPVFHAIQYMLGRQSRERLENFRALGGAQAYPSRTKDVDGVDFSTGSVGLGVATTLFASMVQDYLFAHDMLPPDTRPGRMIALMGDAELDEGNVFEALLEGWKHDVRNLWWVIDYNRQSLDGVVNDNLFQKITQFFETVGWRVINLKYGKKLEHAFQGPAGEALKTWIDNCPNQLYSALTFKGGPAWRDHLRDDLRGTVGFSEFLDSHDDDGLHQLMTNLGGHDLDYLTEMFEDVEDETPRCFIAYTIKGYGLPIAGHKDNHAGLMTPDQMAAFRSENGIREGREWEIGEGLDIDTDELNALLGRVPLKARPISKPRTPLVYKTRITAPNDKSTSTQGAFGAILNELGRSDGELAKRIVTTSPDVAVSTNLGAWINQRAIFHRDDKRDVFREENVVSPLKWSMNPQGQHVELGIAENNLFLMLSAYGLSEDLFGVRLLPVGTVYDPFVNRGLDALLYATYQDARFMLVGTPSGISLAPEGGAHQSINTPLIGMSTPNLTAFEPAFADELAVLMGWGFTHMQRTKGGSVYFRLTTRPLAQPHRDMTAALEDDIISGAYWVQPPRPDTTCAIVYCGAVAPEAQTAAEKAGAALLAVTSPDRLHQDWLSLGQQSHAGILLSKLSAGAGLVTVLDGHPAALSWLGGVHGHRICPLGVTTFGQSADIEDLYRLHGINTDSIIEAANKVPAP